MGALACLPLASAFAQQRPPTAGSELRPFLQTPQVPSTEPPKLEIPVPPQPAPSQDAGLKLDVKGFRISGLSVLDPRELEAELNAATRGFVGEGRGFNQLNEAAQQVTNRLRDAGYFLAQAYLPVQKVDDGVVEIAVLEGRLGKVCLVHWPGQASGKSGKADDFPVPLRSCAALPVPEGAPAELPVSTSIVESLLSALAPGSVLRDNTVERALLLVGDLRGIKVESVLLPGETPGTADLVLKLSPSRWWEAAVDLDNLGAPSTGDYRLGASLDWNSPFGRGDVMSLQLIQGVQGWLSFGRISYLAPVGPYGTKAGAAYSALEYELGKGTFKALNAGGSASVGSLFVLHPVVRNRNLNLFANLSGEQRRLRDSFKTLELDNERVLDVGVLTLVGDSRDTWLYGGINTFSLSYTAGSVELLSPLQQIIDGSAIGRRVAGSFNKANIEYSRLQQFDLDAGYFGFIALSGQWASKNLDASEKVSLGGPRAVRAFNEGQAASDSAIRVTVELRKPLALPARYDLPGFAIGSVFFDYAHGEINKNPLITDQYNRVTLSGAGLGLRWGLPEDFLLNATVAWPLISGGADNDASSSPRFYFMLSKTF